MAEIAEKPVNTFYAAEAASNGARVANGIPERDNADVRKALLASDEDADDATPEEEESPDDGAPDGDEVNEDDPENDDDNDTDEKPDEKDDDDKPKAEYAERNMLVRMRDGSELPVSDLKRNYVPDDAILFLNQFEERCKDQAFVDKYRALASGQPQAEAKEDVPAKRSSSTTIDDFRAQLTDDDDKEFFEPVANLLETYETKMQEMKDEISALREEPKLLEQANKRKQRMSSLEEQIDDLRKDGVTDDEIDDYLDMLANPGQIDLRLLHTGKGGNGKPSKTTKEIEKELLEQRRKRGPSISRGGRTAGPSAKKARTGEEVKRLILNGEL